MSLFYRTGNLLTLFDGVNRRVWRLKNGLLVGQSVFGLKAMGGEVRNAISYDRLTTDLSGAGSTIRFDGTAERFVKHESFMAPHLAGGIRFVDLKRGLRLTWQFRLFPGTPGWESFIDFTSQSLPLDEWRIGRREDRLDVIPINTAKAALYLAAYRAGTDKHNEFVALSEHVRPAGAPLYLDGNILRVEQPDGSGLVILKIGPGTLDRREKVAANFRVEKNAVVVLGCGLEPRDFQVGRTIRSHSVIVVPYRGRAAGAISAVRAFWRQRWQYAFNGPRTVMVNPWGGGGQYLYRHYSDKFLIREINASRLLHATHYQLDDGWQAGGTLADVLVSGLVPERNFWKVHPGKFPNGFLRLKKAAERARIGLGLWFLPNVNQNYANWKEEADWLVAFHQKYGMDHFKIDGVMHRTRAAELNLDRLLRRVYQRTGEKIYFNLDVTAGVRLGFLYAPEFGPLFPANRYPQSPLQAPNKYHPPNTLRNFWLLAHYIPAHLIQVEVPNIWFNPADFGAPGKIAYKANDPHHPRKYGPEYCAAMALFGAPLFWLQPSRTDPALIRRYGRIMRIFHEHRDRIVEGTVYPIGPEPNGRSITGFASVRNDGGYALIFRETGGESGACFQIPDCATAELETLISSAPAGAELKNGKMAVTLRARRSFALFRWRNP